MFNIVGSDFTFVNAYGAYKAFNEELDNVKRMDPTRNNDFGGMNEIKEAGGIRPIDHLEMCSRITRRVLDALNKYQLEMIKNQSLEDSRIFNKVEQPIPTHIVPSNSEKDLNTIEDKCKKIMARNESLIKLIKDINNVLRPSNETVDSFLRELRKEIPKLIEKNGDDYLITELNKHHLSLKLMLNPKLAELIQRCDKMIQGCIVNEVLPPTQEILDSLAELEKEEPEWIKSGDESLTYELSKRNACLNVMLNM